MRPESLGESDESVDRAGTESRPCPLTERAFHIVEFTPPPARLPVSFCGKTFRIMKFDA
ncbi:hypothetical protein CBM2623_B30131 [Cupriavidus taiwanensis]|nr:hypothetical protein CBM2608_B30133 [Cupriavidus taiwanensis]SPA34484.1 hypothetical protein CBM2623_B30131 [Cupriavidus taiwanensis]